MSDAYTAMSVEDEATVQEIMREFGELQTWRNTFGGHWEEIAELILPSHRNTFFFGNQNFPGEKKTDKQVDASGMMALSRFAAIMDSLMTPRNQIWHALEADDDYVMKDRATRLWFEQVTKILFKLRYAPHANYSSQNQAVWQSLGAFGTGPIFIDEFDGPTRGFRYKALPLGEWFMRENHQGIVNSGIRWFKMTAYQHASKWPNNIPGQIKTALENRSQNMFNYLHRINEREAYDRERLDAKGKAFSSHYVFVEGKCLMQPEGGYHTWPVPASRYDQAPGEVYGRSPAMMVLPALKTLNAEKRVFLKQGHRAADPILLTADDGLMTVDLRPGAQNPGGWSADGKPLVGTLPTGDIQITKEMMADEKGLINDAFLVTLFQILTETPQMTATEVIERTNEKGILIAPTAGRQQSEYLGPKIDRELDIASRQGLLPPMPPRLLEARGAYSVRYTSPLARAARSQEAAGFMRSVEGVKELVQITQDPSLLDTFDFDVATRAIATDIQGVPESWMADDDAIQKKRQNRAKQQQVQQQIQMAPAKAAMMKAEAVQAKAGMGQDQQQQPQGPQQ